MKKSPCPKCGGEMRELGVVLGLPTYMQRAEAEKKKGDVETDVKNVRVVEAYSCGTCRIIEMYAS